MATLELKLEGNSTVFVDIDDATLPAAPGEVEIDDRAQVSRGTRKITERFETVSNTLKGLMSSIEQQIDGLARKPDKLEVELGGEIRGKGDLWLVKGEAGAHMKIKLTWDKPKPTA